MSSKLRLFPRSKKPGAALYVKFQVRGKQYLWSTKTDDPRLARTRALHYRQQVTEGAFHMVRAMQTRSGLPKLGEVITEYLAMPYPDEITKKQNVSSLRLMMKESRLSDHNYIDQLTKDVGLNWQKATHKNPQTSNSVLRKAKSVFSKRALFTYQTEIPLQLIQNFLNVPSLREPERLPELPSEDAVTKARDGIQKGSDLYNAFLLAAYAGLRSAEIQAARWDWLDGDILFVGGKPEQFTTKSGKWRTVRLSADVLSLLHKNESLFICGDGASQLVLRGLPVVLRAYGFTSRNPVHSLRRWYGSHIAQQHGLWAAKNSLGHSSQAVTEQFYARQLQVTPGLSYTVQTGVTSPSSPGGLPPAQ